MNRRLDSKHLLNSDEFAILRRRVVEDGDTERVIQIFLERGYDEEEVGAIFADWLSTTEESLEKWANSDRIQTRRFYNPQIIADSKAKIRNESIVFNLRTLAASSGLRIEKPHIDFLDALMRISRFSASTVSDGVGNISFGITEMRIQYYTDQFDFFLNAARNAGFVITESPGGTTISDSSNNAFLHTILKVFLNYTRREESDFQPGLIEIRPEFISILADNSKVN